MVAMVKKLDDPTVNGNLMMDPSGNTSKPASRGHFKTGQLRVADDSCVAVDGSEARVRSSVDSGAHPLQPSHLSPAVRGQLRPPGFTGAAAPAANR